MTTPADYRPDRGEYLMSAAVDQAARCSCRKTAVGAIIARDDRIISTGYNGTIAGFKNCIDGGCPRCKDSTVESGTYLDRCISVHAEQNALIAAARFGVSVEGAVSYVTSEPCLECTKSLIQAQVSKIRYWKPYPLPTQSHALRDEMRKHAAAKETGATVFSLWVPETNVLGLEGRYQAIKDRIQAYVTAQ